MCLNLVLGIFGNFNMFKYGFWTWKENEIFVWFGNIDGIIDGSMPLFMFIWVGAGELFPQLVTDMAVYIVQI